MALTGAGATFPNPIYTKWFDTYAKATGVRINYQSIGSGGGIRQFTEGTVDFGATDGPMSNDQMAAVQGNVLHVPTVLGADVLTYNLPAIGAAKLVLDGDAIAGIFLGRITKWNDPEAGGAQSRGQAAEHRHHRGAPVGRLGHVVHLHRLPVQGVAGVEGEGWGGDVGELADRPGRQGNEGVTQQVKQTEGAIGYVELIYAASNGLSFADIKNASGTAVTPNLKSVTAAAQSANFAPDTDFRVSITNAPGADAYPIASFTWLLIKPNNPDRPSPSKSTTSSSGCCRPMRSGWRPTCSTRRCRSR